MQYFQNYYIKWYKKFDETKEKSWPGFSFAEGLMVQPLSCLYINMPSVVNSVRDKNLWNAYLKKKSLIQCGSKKSVYIWIGKSVEQGTKGLFLFHLFCHTQFFQILIMLHLFKIKLAIDTNFKQ